MDETYERHESGWYFKVEFNYEDTVGIHKLSVDGNKSMKVLGGILVPTCFQPPVDPCVHVLSGKVGVILHDSRHYQVSSDFHHVTRIPVFSVRKRQIVDMTIASK